MNLSDLIDLYNLRPELKIIYTLIFSLIFIAAIYCMWVPPKILDKQEQNIEHTRSDFSVLFQDITGIQIDRTVTNKKIPLLLHGDSINELRPYIDKGWVTLESNGNIAIGAGAQIGNSIRDRKHNHGILEGYYATIYESYFD